MTFRILWLFFDARPRGSKWGETLRGFPTPQFDPLSRGRVAWIEIPYFDPFRPIAFSPPRSATER